MYNQRIYIVAGSVTGISVAVYLVYRYIKTNGSCSSNSAEIKTSRPARIEVKVPRQYAGSIIGPGGSLIRAIEKETGTKITMKKELDTEEFSIFEIRGASENAQLVETKFLNIIRTESEMETEEVFIPHNACGMIIGKNGQRIRKITTISKTRIKVDSEAMNEQGQHKVIITGTREQIDNAKSMIYETLSRSTTKGTDKLSEVAAARDHNNHVCALLGLRGGFVEVFVSAMESPSRFWIQVFSVKSLELDNLVQKMTKCYTEPRNCMQHSLKQVSIGDFVASPYGKDENWYRAKVIEVSENELTLFYLDYGDTAKIGKNNVLELDVQFLKLRFQAIECRLAYSIPESGEWTDPAKEFFRKLCRVAQWKTLEAKVMNLHDLKFEQSREIVLDVELYDRKNGKNIRISEEMVKKGFAKFKGQVVDKK